MSQDQVYAIVGSRTFTDRAYMTRVLNTIFADDIGTVISGGAAGADTLVREWALEHKKHYIEYKPDYVKYANRPRYAPLARNELMARHADVVLLL